MRAIIDLDELETFIYSFGNICGQLRENKQHISHEFKDLHEVWKGKNYDEFEQVFEEAIAEIEQFLQMSEMYAEYLRKKGQKVEQYLQGSY
jgi:uncharacterized protein YukE